nr:MAG TPA: hypothetical protein [Caudoviricetes sp.]
MCQKPLGRRFFFFLYFFISNTPNFFLIFIWILL